jgi:hypothetical protein
MRLLQHCGMLILLLTFCVSCRQGHLKPEGFPALYPCKIYVELDGKPADNVEVIFRPADTAVKWSIGGTTDSQGNLDVLTHGVHRGIPLGNYHVVFFKQEEDKSKYEPPVEGSANYDEEFELWMKRTSNEILVTYTLIDPKFEKKETTPYTIEVGKSGNEFKFDLGKSIKQRI